MISWLPKYPLPVNRQEYVPGEDEGLEHEEREMTEDAGLEYIRKMQEMLSE